MSTFHSITVRAEHKTLFPLLREGFDILAGSGTSLQSLLGEDLGLSGEVLDSACATVFLDGHPVDDLETARLRPGCRLALSGAMPGVCGITMRRHSPVGGMRSGIALADEAEEDDTPDAGEGSCRVLLFNLALNQAGPAFLEHGVLVEAARLLRVDPANVAGAELDGEAVEWSDLLRGLDPQRIVVVRTAA
ncbi:hypothetical protein [Desulfohalovibrio reitneri]|uniref:hypothetical protein n=1 Tax=Desulfohalovibrio reitneri TaxID=1307759 RepID=UPI000A6173A8|nr:hypothetical protein [Desulfohalovibrio reitneri]